MATWRDVGAAAEERVALAAELSTPPDGVLGGRAPPGTSALPEMGEGYCWRRSEGSAFQDALGVYSSMRY